MKKLITIIAVVLMVSVIASAADVANWNAFVIRNASSGGASPTITDETSGVNAGYKVFSVQEGGQKAGWGADIMNNKKVGDIESFSIDHSKLGSSVYGPYLNIWITDGTNYAVIANEPSNGEWVFGGARNAWDNITWDILKTKTAKVYETDGKPFVLPSGSTYTFADFATYTIATPSAHWGGGGAPDVLGATPYKAYGFNWIFGDSQSNYVGQYPVANPTLIPEPATMSILALGGLLLRRKK